jgi:hypothetical protein
LGNLLNATHRKGESKGKEVFSALNIVAKVPTPICPNTEKLLVSSSDIIGLSSFLLYRAS